MGGEFPLAMYAIVDGRSGTRDMQTVKSPSNQNNSRDAKWQVSIA